MRKKTVEERLYECRVNIIAEIAQWKHINENGCNDPFWPDGCNMNLARNHIIYYKQKAAQICRENGLTLPNEYYLPLPPEVDNKYMAKPDQKERVQRLKQTGNKLTTRKVKYDE